MFKSTYSKADDGIDWTVRVLRVQAKLAIEFTISDVKTPPLAVTYDSTPVLKPLANF